MRLKNTLLQIFLLQTVLINTANAQLFTVEQFDNKAGLSNSAINKVYVDKDGIVWIATWDGLNYYDGYGFHKINYGAPNGSTGIANNVIQGVQEDLQHNIWITTIEGISRYNKLTGEIINYFYNSTPNKTIGEHEYGLTIDKNGNVYAYTPGGGISKYDDTAGRFMVLRTVVGLQRLAKIGVTANNTLCVLSASGVLHFLNTGNKILNEINQVNGVNNFFVLDEKLFVSTNSKQLNTYSKNGTLINAVTINDAINAMYLYNEHYLVAWRDKGLDVWDQNMVSSSYMNDIVSNYKEIKVTDFYSTIENTLWLGTDGGGVIKATPKNLLFGTVDFLNLNLSHNIPVRAFCNSNNDLWVATKGMGIIVYKNFNFLQSNKTVDYLVYTHPAQLDNNAVYALKRSRNNDNIYIGSDGPGLCIYNTQKKKFTKWDAVKGNNNAPKFGSVYSIYEDKDSSLWLGTSGYGLVHLKLNYYANETSIAYCNVYSATGNNKGPINNIIYTVSPGNKNILWVGCRYGGLNYFDTQNKIFYQPKYTNVKNDLSNKDVLYTYNDSRGNLWVGTSYGLNVLKNTQLGFDKVDNIQLTTAQGLPNNTVHAITEDDAGNIWISTNKGIAKIEWPTLKIINYQESDGLQSSEFSDGAVWKGFGNRLFFGGIAGFNNFNPSFIKPLTYMPNILLSNIMMGGSAKNVNGLIIISVNNQDALNYVLERKNNYFDIELQPVNFSNAQKCEFSYYLDGYDKEWHTQTGICKIVYGNLPAGNYALKIKWSNGAGAWSPQEKIITLSVKQYIWLTPIAILLYAIAVAVIVYIIYKYRRDGLKEKHKLEKEKLLRAKEDEIHQNRINFFTNIAHELQTPLTLITGSFERMVEKIDVVSATQKAGHYPGLIRQQTAKLTYLLQQLFEFRKIETPYYNPRIEFINISEFLNNLAIPFTAIAENNKQDFGFSIQPEIKGGLDKDKMEKVLFNLLSNAFKHTPVNGEIFLEAKIDRNVLQISVQNSGVALTDAQVNKLFDIFYTANNPVAGIEKFGTGIGLAFTRQLVQLMDGAISVTNLNNGVCFTVAIPVHTEENIDNLHGSKQNHPSYLYKILTDANLQVDHKSTGSINKDAIINSIVDTGKETVVIVEDENEIRFLLRDILKDNYNVFEAEDGEEALKLIHTHNPAIVISDVMMPKMNGLELCNTIKNTNSICHIPVILLSAKTTEEQHMEGYDVGADAYISKPFNTSHLLLRVRKLISYRTQLTKIFKESVTLPDVNTPEIEDEDKAFLNNLYKIIEENIIDPGLSAQFLEKHLLLSRMQLYRKLKSLSAMTPNEFIRNTRLQIAAKLLQSTRLSVNDIYYQTGFNNQSYFFREFKKKFGAAPNDYREQFHGKFI